MIKYITYEYNMCSFNKQWIVYGNTLYLNASILFGNIPLELHDINFSTICIDLSEEADLLITLVDACKYGNTVNCVFTICKNNKIYALIDVFWFSVDEIKRYFGVAI